MIFRLTTLALSLLTALPALAERADCPVVTLDGRLTARVQGTPWQSLIVAPRDLTATM